jgi:hypothetical protein
VQARSLQPQPDASRGFGGIIGNQHPVGGFDAICRSIGIGHSDPAWDGGHRERPKRHEAMWRAMAGRQGCGNNERRNLAAVPRPMTSSTERRQRTGSNTLHIRASSGPASADGSNLGGRNQDLKPVQRGVRGKQGGAKGGRPDEARFRSRLQVWKRIHSNCGHCATGTGCRAQLQRARSHQLRLCTCARSAAGASRTTLQFTTDVYGRQRVRIRSTGTPTLSNRHCRLGQYTFPRLSLRGHPQLRPH